MGYRLDLSFKNCEPNAIYKHLEEFENLLLNNAEEYIKQNLCFLRIDTEKDRWYNVDQVDNFIARLFKHHIWYCQEIQSLCIVCGSNIKEIDEWFDGYVYFQNSTDQNYPYETWDFNAMFRGIKEHIKNMPVNDLVEEYLKTHDYYEKDEILKDLDYYRKDLIYETCEKLINPIWEKGFGISFIDGALDQNKFKLRRMCIHLLLEKEPELKSCFFVIDTEV